MELVLATAMMGVMGAVYVSGVVLVLFAWVVVSGFEVGA